MTPEEREAVRALIAALPKCEECGKPAVLFGREYRGAEPCHYCDKHGAGAIELDYVPALRKLQAMLDPEAP